MNNAARSHKLLRTGRTWLLTLGLFGSTLVGCAGSLVREDDALANCRRDLATVVETGVLTNDDTAKFYGTASLEIEWRANQSHWPSGTGSAVSSITEEVLR